MKNQPNTNDVIYKGCNNKSESSNNKIIWSSEYVYYVKNGRLPIDEALLAHMREHDFTVPALTDADLPFINEVLVAQNQIHTDS